MTLENVISGTAELNKTYVIKNSLCLTSNGGKKRNCVCGDGFVELKSTNGSEVTFENFENKLKPLSSKAS